MHSCDVNVLFLPQDTFFRYLKSPVYKEIQKKALNPEPHNFTYVAKLLSSVVNKNAPGIAHEFAAQKDTG